MFPLGSVLFPTMVLPLRVFEPRYHALMQHCLAEGNEPEFGVVLIDRGREVGGGDHRTTIGTVARILEVQDGGAQLLVQSVGTRRIRVDRWLPDDPYPRAEISDLADMGDLDAWTDDARSTIAGLRRLLARMTEAGYGVVPATIELSDDPLVASYQAAAIAPFGLHDQQRLLAADGPVERYARLHELIIDQIATLDALLADDPDAPLNT
jgi:uncharacterized protein